MLNREGRSLSLTLFYFLYPFSQCFIGEKRPGGSWIKGVCRYVENKYMMLLLNRVQEGFVQGGGETLC